MDEKHNTGYWNSGNRNSGDWNSGYFCAQEGPVYFFDRPADGMTHDQARNLIPHVDMPVGCQWVPESEMTDEEKAKHPKHKKNGGYLKVLHKSIREAFPAAWEQMSEEKRQQFKSLPNFDADKFLAITGVDAREESAPSVPSEVVIDGRRYVLAEE